MPTDSWKAYTESWSRMHPSCTQWYCKYCLISTITHDQKQGFLHINHVFLSIFLEGVSGYAYTKPSKLWLQEINPDKVSDHNLLCTSKSDGIFHHLPPGSRVFHFSSISNFTWKCRLLVFVGLWEITDILWVELAKSNVKFWYAMPMNDSRYLKTIMDQND